MVKCTQKKDCEVVTYYGKIGWCQGWKTFSGQCKVNINPSWATYTISDTKFRDGSSDFDITEMWGDVDTVHFDWKNHCIQVEGKKVADHNPMEKANAWLEKN
jgi:hypothetical protein